MASMMASAADLATQHHEVSKRDFLVHEPSNPIVEAFVSPAHERDGIELGRSAWRATA